MLKVILVNLLLALCLSASTGLPSSYYKIKDSALQKKRFFEILAPMIEKERQKILDDRAFIQKYFHSGLFGFRHDGLAIFELIKIKQRYKIDNLYNLDEYLLKVDVVPTSIILAQAALESGWGKSRFVRQANNIFGQWTYSGRGLIPKNRNEGAKHRIKIFDSLQSAISGYLININVGWGYRSLREKRLKLRKEKGDNINGLDLYMEYINYSEIREEYIRRLKLMIVNNNLLEYD